MTRTEDNAWYWCAGVLVGEVLAFWFAFDVDYYRMFWPVGLAVLIVWAFIRRDKNVCGTKAKQDDK